MESKGYKSTEFWLSFVAIIVSGLMASGLFEDGSTVMKAIAMAGGVLTTMGYTVSRTLYKRKLIEAPKE